MTVATQLKRGRTVLIDGNLYNIEKTTHITPGKGNAIVQTELRNVKTGVKTEKRFRSSEDVETVDIFTRKMDYLYSDGDVHHFMDKESYEQYELQKDILGNALYYLQENQTYEVSTYEGAPIGIALPQKMTMKIVETTPAEKGVTGKTKPAKLETGLTVNVPLFIDVDESIVINTDSNEYLERAKS